MKTICVRGALAALFVLAFASFSTTTKAFDDDLVITAEMRGLGEVPPTNSQGKAFFHGKINADKTAITFTLTWRGITGPPLFSHIHFGPSKENGGVMVFFCGGGGKPDCVQATSGKATGTITAADITGPSAQGIDPAPAGQFSDVIRAILTNNAYANLHTAKFPGGEVRGQVVVQDEEDN